VTPGKRGPARTRIWGTSRATTSGRRPREGLRSFYVTTWLMRSTTPKRTREPRFAGPHWPSSRSERWAASFGVDMRRLREYCVERRMPNKPFHLTPGLAPFGRSVRRRRTAALAGRGTAMETINLIRNCMMTFRKVCPKTWEQLSSTSAPAMRFCGTCNREVFLCKTDGEPWSIPRPGTASPSRCPAGRPSGSSSGSRKSRFPCRPSKNSC